MYTSTLALAIAPLFLLARADVNLDRDDVPRECTTICNPIVDLTRACDTDLRGDDNDREEDRLEVQCVCTNDSFNVARIAALCANCIHQYAPNNRDNDDDDDDDDIRDDTRDIDEILFTCGWASTTYVASATAAVAGITVDAARPTDANQLTTTIVGGTGTRSEPSATPTDDSGSGSGNNDDNNNNNDNNDSSNNNNDATATDNASGSGNADNAAAGLAPFGIAGAAVIGAALLLA
ncbi:hypothetical protein F66182_10234 [Fusarium sp. NRRL 66182]|nr:hypothetical protein F66182_10234 [Fusarium sp. NRRL 66182]